MSHVREDILNVVHLYFECFVYNPQQGMLQHNEKDCSYLDLSNIKITWLNCPYCQAAVHVDSNFFPYYLKPLWTGIKTSLCFATFFLDSSHC